MQSKWLKPFIVLLIAVLMLTVLWSFSADASVPAQQQPTVAVPTVTGTPIGVFITVRMDQDQINVRSGPNTTYPKVGVLLAGQQVPAKGRTSNGEWVLVDYPGAPGGMAWVYTPLVDISGGALPVVEPPPTPTPLYTTTIDPTLAAQFIVTSVPTRLPTFTAPAPLAIPTFEAATGSGVVGRIPMGLVIIALAALGIFLGIFSLFQGR